jgi:hypothetical protein
VSSFNLSSLSGFEQPSSSGRAGGKAALTKSSPHRSDLQESLRKSPYKKHNRHVFENPKEVNIPTVK